LRILAGLARKPVYMALAFSKIVLEMILSFVAKLTVIRRVAMPRRSILSATERATLLALPDGRDDIIRHYTLSEPDLPLIRQHRGDGNRLGFAVQLCLLRYPGYAMGSKMAVTEPVIQWVASQIRADASSWAEYGERDETRREHFQELRTYLGLSPFGLADFRFLADALTDIAIAETRGWYLPLMRWRRCGNGGSSYRPWPSSNGSVPKRSPAPTGASTGHWQGR
jgi:hypothetical protein